MGPDHGILVTSQGSADEREVDSFWLEDGVI